MLNNTQFLDLMKSYMNPEFYMSSMKNIPSVIFHLSQIQCKEL